MSWVWSVLGVQPFRRLFASRLASVLASAMVPVALAFAVLDPASTGPGGPGSGGGGGTAGGAGALGLVLAVGAVSQVVFLLAGGVLADRWPRKPLMASAECAAAVAHGAIALLVLTAPPTGPLTGAGRTSALVACSAVAGAASALFMPASTGIVPTVVPAAQLQAANSLLGLSRNTGAVVGASLAGALVALAGPGWALAAAAALYAASGLLLAGMRAGYTPRAQQASAVADLRAGWREFTARQWVWVVVAQFAVLNACFSGLTRVLGPLVCLRAYAGVTSWSLALTAQAVGLLAGGLIALRLRPRRPIRAAVAATFAFIPPLLLLALHAPLSTLVMAMALTGGAAALFSVLWNTTLQHHVPAHALSRVSSYDMLGSFGLVPLALALAGPLSDHLGTRATLLGGAGLLTISVLAALTSPQVRHLTTSPTGPLAAMTVTGAAPATTATTTASHPAQDTTPTH